MGNSYLKSPIVELVVGTGDEQATLTAHQDLLTQSPFFEQACADFAGDIVSAPTPANHRV